MNPNEMRGYIFFGYGLLCASTVFLSGYYPSGLFMGLFALFLLLGIAFFAAAMAEKRAERPAAQPSPLRLGQPWSEFNCFRLQVDKVAMKRGVDGQRLCEVLFHVENWLLIQKQDEHNLSVRLQAVAEHEHHHAEATLLGGEALLVAAGETGQASCTVLVPEQAERVTLEFVVTLEQEGKTYRQQYEFYPAHYEAR